MSADVLRRAAELMRARATAATQGQWGTFGMTVLAATDGSRDVDNAVEVAQGLTRDAQGRPRTFDIDHIASWHPAVALAVAHWLETAADRCDEFDYVGEDRWFPPLAVARAYLGSTNA